MTKSKKKRKYTYSTDNLQKLLALTAALDYELKKAEKIRKEISKLKLRILK